MSDRLQKVHEHPYCAACSGHGNRHDRDCTKVAHRPTSGGNYCEACFDFFPCEAYLRPIVLRIVENEL